MAKGAKTGRDKDKKNDGPSSEKKGTGEASSKRGRSQRNDSDAKSSKPNKSGKGDTKGSKPAKGGSKNKSSKPAKGGGKAARPNVFQRLIAYFKGVRSEMRKVVWPDREEVANSSIIVIATIIFFTLFVLVIDQISSFVIIDQLARLGQ
jgi:preprotein translocase subunit SecE